MITITAKNCLPTTWKVKDRRIAKSRPPGQNQFKDNVGNLARLDLRTENDKGTESIGLIKVRNVMCVCTCVHLWVSMHMVDGEDQRQTLCIFFSCFPLDFWSEVCDWTWNYRID